MMLGDIDVDRLIAECEAAAELDRVIGPAALAEDILAHRDIPARPLPWGETLGCFGLRAGELTIWGGENGSGKSLMLGQVIAWLLPEGERVLVASLEMHPRETLARMIRQCAGCQPGPDYVRRWCAWAEGRLWLYDQIETIPAERLLALSRAAVSRLGCTHIVIDSLVKAGLPQDGNGYLSAQTDFVSALQHLAKHTGAHVHLVAHIRKPERGQVTPSKYDLRGASQLSDLADNVVLVSRNHRKAEALQVPEHLRSAEERELCDQADGALVVAKQRETGWEGRFSFDHHGPSRQFVRRGGGAIPWHGF